jgi:hypothetical protein
MFYLADSLQTHQLLRSFQVGFEHSTANLLLPYAESSAGSTVAILITNVLPFCRHCQQEFSTLAKTQALNGLSLLKQRDGRDDISLSAIAGARRIE